MCAGRAGARRGSQSHPDGVALQRLPPLPASPHLRLWYTVTGFSPMSPMSSNSPSSAAVSAAPAPAPLPLLRWRCSWTAGPAAPSRAGASVAASEAACAVVSAGRQGGWGRGR